MKFLFYCFNETAGFFLHSFFWGADTKANFYPAKALFDQVLWFMSEVDD